MQRSLGHRRGPVFSVRVTPTERAALEALRAELGGPRALGPWLVWRALGGDRIGSTGAGARAAAGYYPSSGTTPAEVVPEQLTAPSPGAVLQRRRRTTGPGDDPPSNERLILDLCAGSGAWSAPYAAKGYRVERVTLPALDVRSYEPPARAWGVLAAPPCDQFSLARNGHPKLSRDMDGGLEIVGACLRVIFAARPRWWALENPVGLLSRFLGTPQDVWQPCDFGDPWTKRTAVWGDYTIPRRGPFVQPLGGGPLCALCEPGRRRTSWCSRPDHRAITPPGFARAFCEANP